MFKKKPKNIKGFTLIEVLISIFVLSIMIGVIAVFVKTVFKVNNTESGSLSNSIAFRSILNPITSEIRSASISSLGSYPIETATDTTFTFYADVDNDGTKEKVRYFLSNNKLQRGVIKPTGNPYSYGGTETIKTIVDNVRNTVSDPVFSYYDSSYTGTSSAMTQPVSVQNIRLIKISIIIDSNPNMPPGPVTSTTQVSLRNLKDNL